MRRTLIPIVLLLVSGVVTVWQTRPDERTTLSVGTATISAHVLRSDAEQERGMSGIATLAPDEGYLFVRKDPDRPSLWMKGMRFPIDIIWIAPDGVVIGVDADISPDSYPARFAPPASVGWVLEIASGTAAAHGIIAGSPVSGLPVR